jgi:hypothetical protein
MNLNNLESLIDEEVNKLNEDKRNIELKIAEVPLLH